jgi:hypothetical protein
LGYREEAKTKKELQLFWEEMNHSFIKIIALNPFGSKMLKSEKVNQWM